MRQIAAQREIEQLMASGARLTPDAIYDLTLEATGSKEQAEEAMKAIIANRLRKGENPG
jgi:hypothetical protein